MLCPTLAWPQPLFGWGWLRLRSFWVLGIWSGEPLVLKLMSWFSDSPSIAGAPTGLNSILGLCSLAWSADLSCDSWAKCVCSLVVANSPSRGSVCGVLSMGEMLEKHVLGSCDQLCNMGHGLHKFTRAHSGRREGRGLDIYCIYKLCEHDIKITEPLSPSWHGKLLEHQVGGEKFPLVLKLLGTNSMWYMCLYCCYIEHIKRKGAPWHSLNLYCANRTCHGWL